MNARSRFAAALLGAACALGCSNSTNFSGPSDPGLDPEESALIYTVNQIRSDAGVGNVKVCTSLNVSATGHSDDMRDKGYFSDMGQDGSNVRTRSCAAGYAPGCGSAPAMAELVGDGIGTGKEMAQKWSSSGTGGPALVDPAMLVAGVGLTLTNDQWWWTLDLASIDDASCN